jgi:hypothetical protein
MNCEQFEAAGLGLGRQRASLTERDRREHAQACPRCAALEEAWLQAQGELRAWRDATQQAQAPARVEVRLLQEFRARRVKTRTAAMLGAWALGAAAVLAMAVSWWNWRAARPSGTVPVASGSTTGDPPIRAQRSGWGGDERMRIADNDGDFTLLPGSLPQETDDAAIVRVRLERRALGALGLPVNEERAGEWLQVDLLVGEDGQPRAVRLPSETSR